MTRAGPANHLHRLIAAQLGSERSGWLVDGLEVHPTLLEPASVGHDQKVARAVVAQALASILLHGVLERVPDAAAYAAERYRHGHRLFLDHLTVYTAAGVACGELAGGQQSVARILRPLGYEPGAEAELGDDGDHGITLRCWRHADLPAHVAQFVVGEIQVQRFSPPFIEAAERIVSSSQDPLTGLAEVNLGRLAVDRGLSLKQAESLVGELVSFFSRHHRVVALSDYETVLAESGAMAWLATDGTAIHHAADRVDDVVTVAESERAAGRPISDEVQASSTGRVLRVAYSAQTVERALRTGERATEPRLAPGSSFELVTRLPLPDGLGPDLGGLNSEGADFGGLDR